MTVYPYFQTKAGEGGKLFGSITGKDIAEQIQQKTVTIDKNNLIPRTSSQGEHELSTL